MDGYANHLELTLTHKYFKEISHCLENADEIHVTGPGTIQEQFTHYLRETPQLKKIDVSESTSTPLSDKRLIEFITRHFN